MVGIQEFILDQEYRFFTGFTKVFIMAEESGMKSFLYGWLGKKKATPEYNMRQTGPKHRQRFLCELRVTVQISSLRHSVWKSQKKSHSTCERSELRIHFEWTKMVNLGVYLKTFTQWFNSATRQVSFNRTKIGGRCQN